MAADYKGLLELLARGDVEFIIVGGVAANLLGSARVTTDIDVVYSRTAENIRTLARVLEPVQPYLRGAPPGLPFRWDEKTIKMGLNFTLTTSLGDLDLLGEVVGGGGYAQLLPFSFELKAFGISARCVNLDRLIQIKRAAGRPKDLEAIAELQALREEQRQRR